MTLFWKRDSLIFSEAVEYFLNVLINLAGSLDSNVRLTGLSYLSGEYTILAWWWESPARLAGNSCLVSLDGTELCWHVCLWSSHVRPHTAPDTQHRCLGEAWQQEAFRRSRLATHTPSHPMYILGEIQLSSSFKCLTLPYDRLCIPPLFLSLFLARVLPPSILFFSVFISKTYVELLTWMYK